jgi:hypothetical protein
MLETLKTQRTTIQNNLWHRIRIYGLLLFVAPLVVAPAFAGEGTNEQDLNKYGGTVIRERSRGPIMVSVPVAYVFGLGSDRSPLYCSPSVRAANASNAVIEELIIGIIYQTASGRSAGSSTSRFSNIKIKRLDSHFFNQLETTHCSGLEGEVTVVRCVYSTGEDCSSDVQTIGFGAIPLRLRPRQATH